MFYYLIFGIACFKVDACLEVLIIKTTVLWLARLLPSIVQQICTMSQLRGFETLGLVEKNVLQTQYLKVTAPLSR